MGGERAARHMTGAPAIVLAAVGTSRAAGVRPRNSMHYHCAPWADGTRGLRFSGTGRDRWGYGAENTLAHQCVKEVQRLKSTAREIPGPTMAEDNTFADFLRRVRA